MELQCNLTQEQRTVYDSAAQLWQDLRQGLAAALVQTNTTSRELWKPFWSAQQRFFKLLCVSLKVSPGLCTAFGITVLQAQLAIAILTAAYELQSSQMITAA